ncbi:MAG: radical SAM protein, partial [Chloroflexota bacterium]|nr:radical SAM protein [Chloroflexota bacterium]
MIREIQAKVLLSHAKQPDPWFGIKYGMNLYRGCQHQCIYCDSRSECYQIENFNDEVLVKANAIDLLRKELASKRVKGIIGTGSMNDPYMPLEERLNLTGRALAVIAEFHFPVHVMTKSDLVLRDLDTLCQINRVYAAVSFTITTADDDLGQKLEPGASLVSERFRAMKTLAEHGIHTGVTMMPILPFIEDDEENIRRIVEQARAHGAAYIIPWFGMSLRDRQRAYYYDKLDALFPGLRQQYELTFGNQYSCAVPNADRLVRVFNELCDRRGIATRMKRYEPITA